MRCYWQLAHAGLLIISLSLWLTFAHSSMTMWRPWVAHRASPCSPAYPSLWQTQSWCGGRFRPYLFWVLSELTSLQRVICGHAGCSCLAPLDMVHLELCNASPLSVQRFEIPSIWACFLINLINFQERVFTISLASLISEVIDNIDMHNADVSLR